MREMLNYFEVIKDKREPWKIHHKLIEIIFMAVVATLCGAETWQAIGLFAKEKEKWFRKYLKLENGVPSHDTFERCFKFIDPKQFQRCFISWTESLRVMKEGEVVAIDGKTMRRTMDNAIGKSPIHIVSAFAEANHLILGQVKTSEKSNEITAIPELLDLLAIEGCIITIDAIGTQRSIVKKIKEKNAHYVLAVKENQKGLCHDIKDYFETALRNKSNDFSFEKTVSFDKGHGRYEKRTYYQTTDISWLKEKSTWEGLSSIGMVVREAVENEKKSIDTRYYISSLDSDIAMFTYQLLGILYDTCEELTKENERLRANGNN